MKSIKDLFVRASFIITLLLILLPTVSASYNYYEVNLMVAVDEEFASTAAWAYAYSPEALARIIIWSTTYYFHTVFNIGHRIISEVVWVSNNSETDPERMLDEAIAETGFVSGMYVGSDRIDVLVAFTDQQIHGAYGIADPSGAVLVQETYPDGVGQATENVLQHELSHLYGAQHHYEDGLMCTMNTYPYWIDFPYCYHVPTALVTNCWCSDCTNIIVSNRTSWGHVVNQGGGGGGPPPTNMPYSTYGHPEG
jgi:hypothetical protein